MRILYSHRVQSRDGQSVHIEELIRALRAQGHVVRAEGPGFYDQAGFGGESRLIAAIRRILPRFAQELAELAYNIPAYHRLRSAHAAFNPDVIYERCNLFYLAGTRLSRRTGTPLLLEVNAPLAEERHAHGGLSLYRLARALEHRSWRAAGAVLPVTTVLSGMVRQAGVPAERVHVIANGVDPARFPPRPEKPEGAPVELGFVGFVRDWHGLDAVIDGMAESRVPCILTIVGDGPARPALQAQASRLGLSDRVRFTGTIPPEKVPGAVSRFDIALQPKATSYASPLKIFDYMAAGCAIVAPAQPNILEVLVDGDTALLFDPSSPGAFWHAISRLIEDATLRRRLGAQARAAIAAEGRTWEANAQTVTEIARKLTRGRKRKPKTRNVPGLGQVQA